jgi:hypothetical protein
MVQQVTLQVLTPSERAATTIMLTGELLALGLAALITPPLSSSRHRVLVLRSKGSHGADVGKDDLKVGGRENG